MFSAYLILFPSCLAFCGHHLAPRVAHCFRDAIRGGGVGGGPPTPTAYRDGAGTQHRF